MRILILILSLVAGNALAYIPPLTSVAQDIFSGRKAGVWVEFVTRHHIEFRAGEGVDLEERMVTEQGHMYSVWKPVGQSPIAAAHWDGQGYLFGRDRWPSRCYSFMRYIAGDSSDQFRDALIADQFTRRDQWLQYKPGFTAEGDPQAWNLKENYLRHEDIFLARVGNGISIAAQGLDDANNQRVVYFNRGFHGVDRLEWRQNGQVSAWNFESFAKRAGDGYYPLRYNFESGGVTLIKSEVQSIRLMKGKPLNDFKTLFRNTSKTPPSSASVGSALRLLLSYR